MDKRAIAKVMVRLGVAKQAVASLQKWSNFEEFDQQWFVFLTAWKSIYTMLEQGAKTSPKSTQWFGTRNAFRRRDQLLQYLFQARNDDSHGLDDCTVKVAGGVGFGRQIKPGPIHVKHMELSFGPAGLHVHNFEADNVAPKFVHIPDRVRLIAVTDRNRQVYQPPREHLGLPLENPDPVKVAELGLSYIEGLVAEAVTLSNSIAK